MSKPLDPDHPWPPWALPKELSSGRSRCSFCRLEIVWGMTIRGKRAPFDPEPPHPNHWITCPKAAEHSAAKRKAAGKPNQSYTAAQQALRREVMAGLAALGYPARAQKQMTETLYGNTVEDALREALRRA